MNFAASADTLRLFLDRLTARSVLGPDEKEAVLSLPVHPRQVAAHREIVRLGERVEHSCLIASGFVGRFSQTEDGRRQLISFHIPGDMADIYSLMIPSAPSALVALTPTTVFQVPHAALRDATARYPAIAAALWRDCVADGMILAQWLLNIGRKNARDRLAHLLCEMAIRYRQIGRWDGRSFPFPVTQEDLSDALGLTAVHVNRSLKGLRQEGLVLLKGGRAEVLDWPGLVFAGEFDATYLGLPGVSEDEMRPARSV